MINTAKQFATKKIEGFATVKPGNNIWFPPLVIIMAITLLYILAPGVVVGNYHFDIFFPLNASQRITTGQIPHTDFHSPVGALYYYHHWIASLIDSSAKQVIWANVMFAPYIFFLGYLLYKPRFNTTMATFIVIAAVLYVLSPRSIGGGPMHISFLASYNKYALALFALVLPMLFIPCQKNKQDSFFLPVLLAIGLVFLFWTKMPFFLAMFAALTGGIIFIQDNRKTWLSALGLSVIILGILHFFTPLNITNYIFDLSLAADQAPSLIRTGKVVEDLKTEWPALVLIFISIAGWLRFSKDRNRITGIIYISGCILGMIAVSNQLHDICIPVLWAIPFYLIYRDTISQPDFDTKPGLSSIISGIAVVIFIFPVILMDTAGSITHLVANKSTNAYPVCHDCKLSFIAGNNENVNYEWFYQIQDKTESEIRSYESSENFTLNEDWHIAAASFKIAHNFSEVIDKFDPGQGILYFTFMDSHSWLLNRSLVKNSPAWLDADRTFSLNNPVPAEKFFRHSQYVFVPVSKQVISEKKRISDIYEPWLEKKYSLLLNTPLWKIYGKYNNTDLINKLQASWKINQNDISKGATIIW